MHCFHFPTTFNTIFVTLTVLARSTRCPCDMRNRLLTISLAQPRKNDYAILKKYVLNTETHFLISFPNISICLSTRYNYKYTYIYSFFILCTELQVAYLQTRSTRVRSSFRHCAQAGRPRDFSSTQSFRPHYGSVIDSATKK